MNYSQCDAKLSKTNKENNDQVMNAINDNKLTINQKNYIPVLTHPKKQNQQVSEPRPVKDPPKAQITKHTTNKHNSGQKSKENVTKN